MKRPFALALLLVYLTFSVGLVVGYHFCGGQLAEIGLFKQPKNCCEETHAEGSCCHNSIAVFKITDDYSGDVSPVSVPSIEFITLVQPIYPLSLPLSFGNVVNQKFDSHKVRHFDKQPTYLVNCVFIV